MATNKIQTGLRLNELMYEKTRALAEEEQRSLNNLIEHALAKYIAEYEAEHGQIKLLSELTSGHS